MDSTFKRNNVATEAPNVLHRQLDGILQTGFCKDGTADRCTICARAIDLLISILKRCLLSLCERVYTGYFILNSTLEAMYAKQIEDHDSGQRFVFPFVVKACAIWSIASTKPFVLL
ncbi:hypothetical protein ElyMa_001633600 [Elysia marginata]|uniref:Uncharacterized protein n=1 Tax=Elysia marginata TaxID=1093978 RepID=A0AAV4JLN4_9GAST|nr:hypothetical protein ElyMa_001633600 [Elysia marginata]